MLDGTATRDWPASETWSAGMVADAEPGLPHVTVGIELAELLGEGASGTVHRGRHALLGRDVAVKRLKHGSPARSRERLLHEGRTMGSLEHPNIVPVHAIGVDDDGRPALVMKKLEGSGWVPGDLERDLQVLVACCEALAYAHERGVVHRDLKPANVLLGPHGEVYVSDWGIAVRLGEPALPGGTPHYMAPEMFDGAVAEASMDVYQLGACLHQVLTGHARNQGHTLDDCRSTAGQPTEPSGVDPELDAICASACAAEPAERPHLSDVREDLVQWLQHRPTRRLEAVAHQRLAELQSSDEPDPVVLTECLFAFRQVEALRPGSDPAGRITALELAIDDAARRDVNTGLAAAWVAELASLGRPVDARVEALTASKQRQRTREARAWDADLGVDYRARNRVYASWLAVFGLLVAPLVVTGLLDHETHAGSLAVAVVFASTLAAAAVLRWEQLTRNRSNRVLLGSLATMGGLLILSRSTAWALGAPVAWMHAIDAALLGASTFVLGLTQGRVTRLIGLVMLLGVPLVLLVPVGWSSVAFVTAVGVTPLAFGLAALRGSREPVSDPPAR